jgi:hypothetical protein
VNVNRVVQAGPLTQIDPVDPMELMVEVDAADAADLVLTGANGENERRMDS